MNPRVINPDPLAVLRDVNNITDQTRPRVRDNFTIVDGGKPPNWQTNNDFNSSVKNNFNFTQDNMKDAFAQAAREGKPLVVMFGSEATQDTKQLIEGTMPGAKNRKDAVYMFVDRSKLDPNSELGRFAASNIGNTNWAYTGIFALKPGANGQPSLDNVVANTWGARGEIPSVIADQLQYAQRRMDAQKGRFNFPQDAPIPQKDQVPPPSQPNDGTSKPGDAKPQQQPGDKTPFSDNTAKPSDKQTEAEKAAEARLNPLMNEIYDSFGQLPKVSRDSYKEREGLYQKAIAAADKIDPADVKTAQAKIERELQAETGTLKEGDSKNAETQNRIKALKERQAQLGLMSSAKGWTRMNHGLNLMHYSQFNEGANEIHEGAKHNPELMNSPQFVEQLKKTPYNASQLEEKFPEVKFGETSTDKPAGSNTDPQKQTQGSDVKVDPKKQQLVPPNQEVQIHGTKQEQESKPQNNKDGLLNQLPDNVKWNGDRELQKELDRLKSEIAKWPKDAPDNYRNTPGGENPGAKIDGQPQTKIEKPEAKIEQPPEAKIEKPQLKFKGTEVDQAVEAALKEGRKLVFKVGTKGCSGCDSMTRNNWPAPEVQQVLDDKAVFVDVDGMKQQDLAVGRLNATEWPVTIIATPYRGPDGKPTFREEGRLEWPEKGDMTTEMLYSFLKNKTGGDNRVRK